MEYIFKPLLIMVVLKILVLGFVLWIDEIITSQGIWNNLEAIFLFNSTKLIGLWELSRTATIIVVGVLSYFVALLIGYIFRFRFILILKPKILIMFIKLSRSLYSTLLKGLNKKGIRKYIIQIIRESLERAEHELKYKVHRMSLRDMSEKIMKRDWENNPIIEITATSTSPVHLWYTSEIVEYMVTQLKIALIHSIPIKRLYFADNKILNLFTPPKPEVDIDIYNMIKYLHGNHIKLIGIQNDDNQVKKYFDKPSEIPNLLTIRIKQNSTEITEIHEFAEHQLSGMTEFHQITDPDTYNLYAEFITEISNDIDRGTIGINLAS